MAQRILHIIDSLARTGLASQLLVLSRGLLEKGFDVHVAALQGRGALAAEFRASGIETTELHRRWPVDPIALYQLHRLVRQLQPNTMHTWNYAAGVYGNLSARAASIPNVVTGLYRIDPWTGLDRVMLMRPLTQGTARLVTNSSYLRERYIHLGLPKADFTVIPPGVPPARASDVSREELLRELRLPPDARIIGVIGRLIPEKRVKDLIWAADLLRVLHDNLRLVIIGDGPLRPQLEQYARLASDLDHIQFLGERPDVWRILPHLDVLWNARENRAPSSAILEAMSAGVPVIASDTPINRELIVEGVTGYLVPLYDRSGRADRARLSDRIFTDQELSIRRAAASRERIENYFSNDPKACRYADLYSRS